MTLQPGFQTIAIHILPNILQSKGKQTMKFGQQNITREIFLFKNYAENEAGRLVLDIILFFQKTLYEKKASGLQLSLKVF